MDAAIEKMPPVGDDAPTSDHPFSAEISAADVVA
jgi:hypothetical protein